MNSIVGPIFNEKVAKKCNLWDPWTLHECTFHGWLSQKVRLKQKKKKKQNKTKRKTRIAENATQKRGIQTAPITHHLFDFV